MKRLPQALFAFGTAVALVFATLACAPAHHPEPLEEVPIGLGTTSRDLAPPSGQPFDADLGPGDAAASASSDDAPDGGGDAGAEVDGGGPRKRANGKPVRAPAPTSLGAAAPSVPPGGESERSRLEAKVAAHEATQAEVKTLIRLCLKQHDQPCVRKAGAALRTAPR